MSESSCSVRKEAETSPTLLLYINGQAETFLRQNCSKSFAYSDGIIAMFVCRKPGHNPYEEFIKCFPFLYNSLKDAGNKVFILLFSKDRLKHVYTNLSERPLWRSPYDSIFHGIQSFKAKKKVTIGNENGQTITM